MGVLLNHQGGHQSQWTLSTGGPGRPREAIGLCGEEGKGEGCSYLSCSEAAFLLQLGKDFSSARASIL